MHFQEQQHRKAWIRNSTRAQSSGVQASMTWKQGAEHNSTEILIVLTDANEIWNVEFDFFNLF